MAKYFFMNENDLSKIIVDTAFKIYKKLGPGLLESVYEGIFAYELRQKELLVETQVTIPVLWDNIKFDQGYRADIIVNKKVLIELKSIEKLMPVHAKQVRTYLRLTDLKLGMLINFNENQLTDGFKRVVNGL